LQSFEKEEPSSIVIILLLWICCAVVGAIADGNVPPLLGIVPERRNRIAAKIARCARPRPSRGVAAETDLLRLDLQEQVMLLLLLFWGQHDDDMKKSQEEDDVL
jgi:hypothetical protein